MLLAPRIGLTLGISKTFTSIVFSTEQPFSITIYLTVVTPCLIGVTSPVVEFTVAISGLVELQLPLGFVFENVTLVPRHKLFDPLI